MFYTVQVSADPSSRGGGGGGGGVSNGGRMTERPPPQRGNPSYGRHTFR